MRVKTYLRGVTHVWGKYVSPTLGLFSASSADEVHTPVRGRDGQTVWVTGRFVGFFHGDGREHIQSGLRYGVRLQENETIDLIDILLHTNSALLKKNCQSDCAMGVWKAFRSKRRSDATNKLATGLEDEQHFYFHKIIY